MISVKGVKKSFEELRVLDSITFDVEKGELVCILGPSGCGKTTLIRILAGLIPQDGGEVFMNSGKIGIMFQEPRLVKWRTVEENVALGLELRGEEVDFKKIENLLEMVDIRDFADSFPNKLSGGMKQRAALARTLAISPEILLMDEPLSALDPVTRGVLQEKILEIHKLQKITALFVTHSIDEAVKMGRRIIVLSGKPTVIKEIISSEEEGVKDMLEEALGTNNTY